MIGRWLERRGRRDDVVMATKLGMDMGRARRDSADLYPQGRRGSLHRLKTDYIDLYQAHTDDKETPLEETLGAFAD